MRRAALAAVALLLAGCGGGDDAATVRKADSDLLAALPVYPGARDAQTYAIGADDPIAAARDWTLPPRADPEGVIAWYVPRLQRAGWKVTGKSAASIRAVRRGATLSLGARGDTLEAIVNADGSS